MLVVHGGGGYGDVLERDPDAVMEDLRDEIISHRVAEEIFHLAYEPGSLRVNAAATANKRRQARDERRHRGKPYNEFVAAWSRKKPRDDILAVYGSWPDAEPTSRIVRM